MSVRATLSSIGRAFRDEWRHMTRYTPGARPWHMAFAAALATGLPLIIGAAMGQLSAGLFASLGGLCFVYMPNTELYHRMAVVMVCAFGMTACYTIGVLLHAAPVWMIPSLALMTAVVTMIQRFYAVGPPGSLFFVMPATIGAFTMPIGAPIFEAVGVFSAGTTLAVTVAFFYSIYVIPRSTVQPTPTSVRNFDFVLVEPVFIGLTAASSLLIAHLLELPRPYWVPVSCIAVMQAATLRDVWRKQISRIAGTIIGVLGALLLVLVPMSDWTAALTILTLLFVIEFLIPRNYALAVIFITPMTILLAETVTAQSAGGSTMVWARLLDTVIGSLVGFLGAALMHHPTSRGALVTLMHRLVPESAVNEKAPSLAAESSAEAWVQEKDA